MNLKLIALAVVLSSTLAFANELPPVQPGDVVISVNGKKMKNNLIALKTLNAMKPGSKVLMEVLRENKVQKISYEVK